MESRPPVSVAILTNAPAPYRTPFFNELADRCRLLVSFDTQREADREWAINEGDFRFAHVFTRSLSVPRRLVRNGAAQPGTLHIPVDAPLVLRKFRPDVVVSLELGFRTVAAAGYCAMTHRPLIIWWEGTVRSEADARRAKVALRTALSSRATRAWANGVESKACLAEYGVSPSDIDPGMTGVDTDFWQAEVERQRVTTRTSLRNDLGLEGTVLLCVGKMTPLKGVREFLGALDLLAADADLPPWSVLFVGSGPLADEVETWTRRHPTIRTALTGYVQQAEMPKYYAAADVFVMPSLGDVWGLVCHEALLAGVPQVTSSFSGAAADLITSDAVGSIVDPRDEQALASAIARLVRAGAPRVPSDLRVRAAAMWSPTAFADRAMASIRRCLEPASGLSGDGSESEGTY